MYAIRSKSTHRFFAGVDTHTGIHSSHHLRMDEIPLLFLNEELARIELLMHHMSPSAYDIVKIKLEIEEPISS